MLTVNLFFQISDEINELAVKARDGKLTADEMKGATCTISNIGSAGGQWFTQLSITQK